MTSVIMIAPLNAENFESGNAPDTHALFSDGAGKSEWREPADGGGGGSPFGFPVPVTRDWTDGGDNTGNNCGLDVQDAFGMTLVRRYIKLEFLLFCEGDAAVVECQTPEEANVVYWIYSYSRGMFGWTITPSIGKTAYGTFAGYAPM